MWDGVRLWLDRKEGGKGVLLSSKEYGMVPAGRVFTSAYIVSPDA